MISLPTTRAVAKSSNPRKLLLYSQPKVGKTSLVSQLDGCLIIDLESSASFFGGMYVDIKTIAKEQKITMFEAFKQVIVALKTQVKESGVFYKYVCIDSLTVMEDLAKELALQMYKSTAIGKNFEGKDIFLLPNGAGELHFRNAMDSLYNSFDGLYSEALILIGHIRSASINKGGQEIQVRDLNVRGEHLAHFPLIAGISLESKPLQRKHEKKLSVKVLKSVLNWTISSRVANSKRFTDYSTEVRLNLVNLI